MSMGSSQHLGPTLPPVAVRVGEAYCYAEQANDVCVEDSLQFLDGQVRCVSGFGVLAHGFGQRLAQAVKRGQGVDEGRAKLAAEITAWHERRLAAEANNEPFDELPPGVDDHRNGT